MKLSQFFDNLVAASACGVLQRVVRGAYLLRRAGLPQAADTARHQIACPEVIRDGRLIAVRRAKANPVAYDDIANPGKSVVDGGRVLLRIPDDGGITRGVRRARDRAEVGGSTITHQFADASRA